MIVIDTNVVVRYLTNDHPQQAVKAKALIDRNDVFVPITVLLESAWVLRSSFGYHRKQIAEALLFLAGLPTVTLGEAEIAKKALDWSRAGMDFADALHLAKAADFGAFATFDRRFARVAAKVSDVRLHAFDD